MSKKSRKLIRSTAVADLDVAVAAQAADDAAPSPFAEYEQHAGRDWGMAFVDDVEPEIVDEAALHALMKEWRHGRATRSIGQALSDAYFALFTVVLLGAMVANAIIGSQAAAAMCNTAGCVAGRTLIPWGVHFAICALTLSLARVFGPVLTSAAEGFWLMDAPISRSYLLRGRLWAVVGGAAGVGAVVSAVVAALAGSPVISVAAWAAATATGAAGSMALAAVEQTRERRTVVEVLRGLFGLLALASLGLMIAVAAERVLLPAAAALASLAGPLLLAGLGVVATLGFGVAAHRRLDQLTRARLASGGALVNGMQGAMFALDLGLARDILVERELTARGHVRPARGRGSGLWALVWRDVQRLRRFPRPLVGVLGAAVVPYVLDAVGLGLIAPLVGALALVMALVPVLGGLRVLSRTRGLARSLPLSTRQIRMAASIVPGVLALIWTVLIVPSTAGVVGGVQRDLMDAVLVAMATGAAGLLGALRWQTAKPVDFQAPMLATSSGAVPPMLIFNLLRGFDMVALVTAPILLGAPPIWAIAIAAAVFGLLTAGFDFAEMNETAKEQQAEIARLKQRPAAGSTVRTAPRTAPRTGPAESPARRTAQRRK